MSEPQFLKPMDTQVTYFKGSGYGFSGTGKTYTTSLIMSGLAKMIGEKNIACFDTEGAAVFVRKKIFEANDQVLYGMGSKSFKDLMSFCRGVEKDGIKLAFIDSVSHVWTDLMRGYKKAKRRSFISISDWGILKEQWSEFTEWVVNSPVHLMVLGRAGVEYGHETGDDGKKELIKTGTKMQAEKDFSFEPSLNLEFVKFRPDNRAMVEMYGLDSYIKEHNIKGNQWLRACVVHKDRWGSLDGMVIPQPNFDDFLPHIKEFDFAAIHNPIHQEHGSEELFEGSREFAEQKAQSKILCEEITGKMIAICGAGRTAKAQKAKSQLLDDVFGTCSWTKIEGMRVEELSTGLDVLQGVCDSEDAMLKYGEES